MTYQELSAALIDLGKSLREHAPKLSGEAPAKIAKMLADNTAKLQRLIRAAVTQSHPDARRLTSALAANAASLDLKRLQQFAKRLGFKLPGGQKVTPAIARARFSQLAAESGVAEAATALVEALARVRGGRRPDTSDDVHRRAELRRLGALPEHEIEMELEEHYSDAQLRALAAAAGIKVTAKSSRRSLTPKVVHLAHRHYENTAAGADR